MKFDTKFLDKHGVKYSVVDGKITVGGYLDLRSLTSIPEGFNPTVGGSLDLRSLTSIPEGFNPTVGGYLDLRSLTSIPEGFNPTVGGYLDLGSLTSIPEGFNPTVGGYLYLNSLTSKEKAKLKVNKNVEGLRLKISLSIEAKFNLRGFSIADGILGSILSRKSGVLKIETVGKKKIMYVVSDENGNKAHGETIAEARGSLRFKTADRDVTPYKGMALDTVKTRDDWVIAYHVCTGACETGIKHFISQQAEVKEEYSLAEILDLTKSAYQGAVFASIVRSAA